MIVVTGAAGFIGSCLVAALNSRGRRDLIVVDHLMGEEDPKKNNLIVNIISVILIRLNTLNYLNVIPLILMLNVFYIWGHVLQRLCRMQIISRRIIMNTPVPLPNGLLKTMPV